MYVGTNTARKEVGCTRERVCVCVCVCVCVHTHTHMYIGTNTARKEVGCTSTCGAGGTEAAHCKGL
jgi:hypothetical protein